MFDNFSKKLHNLAMNAGWRLGKVPDDDIKTWEADWVTEKIQLRNKIHDQDIEIMYLKAIISENEVARKNNYTVKKAWEHYQMVLKLATAE